MPQDQDTRAQTPSASGRPFKPYIPASQEPLEFTVRAVAAGIFFGILFGAANAYLGLRAGLTISTSIPVAVLTVAGLTIVRKLGFRTSILEANTSQTVGSASSSLASGVIFTLPALFLWGLDPSLRQMTVLALFGGLLGVLFMIPLRRFLIERAHATLPYPEGTACAEVLKAADEGGGRARNVFIGLGAGAAIKAFFGGFRILPADYTQSIPLIPKAQLGTEVSAALFGVGYILGPKVATIMVGGGLLSWLVIIPAIAIWGSDLTVPLYPETERLITEMTSAQIWTRYVRYIGAGAVAMGGLITLIRSIPDMLESFRMGVAQIKKRLESGQERIERTARDLPITVVGAGALLIALGMAIVPHVFGMVDTFAIRLFAALVVVVFAFFFVTVSSRIVGLVGVTSNPTSGMTIATLLGTSSVLLFLGWTDDVGKVAAITIGCVVAIAASIAGDTSQDLKTGYLLGATPRRQQVGELIGVLTSAIFVCMTVMVLDAGTGFGTTDLPAPQATLMKVVVEGVLQRSLPWGLVAIGAGIAIVCELLKVPSLPFAVGVYLPLTTTFPVFVGGALAWRLSRSASSPEQREERKQAGILLGSGFVGGEGLVGVAVAAVAYQLGHAPKGIGHEWAGEIGEYLSLLVFVGLVWWFYRMARASRV